MPALTGFRALAAAMVLVGHIEGGRNVGAWWVIRYGWTGVNLFFALSGFLFTLLYFDRFTVGAVSLRNYFLKRAFRVLPLTWFLLAVSLLSGPRYALTDIAAHLTLTHAFFQRYRFSINPPMWTLSLEESFYLVVPALFVALGAVERARPKASTFARVGAVALCLALLTYAGIALGTDLLVYKHQFTGDWDNDLWAMTLLGRFSDFACGILAGLVALRAPDSPWLRQPARATAIFVAGAVTWWCCAHWVDTHGGVYFSAASAGYQLFIRLFAASGALMILGLHGRSWLTPLFASRPVVYLGRISFALYLAQDVWLRHVPLEGHLAHVVRGHLRSEALIVLALYALLNVVAALLHHGLEDPAQRRLRRRFLG